MEELIKVQSALNVPKGKSNATGGYNYRSCEDILKALKDPLSQHSCTLTLSDDVMLVGDRFYIKSTATITNAHGKDVSTSALAREPDRQERMSESQITGSASSYARKYALCGLFAIDDEQDPDEPKTKPTTPKPTVTQRKRSVKRQPKMI